MTRSPEVMRNLDESLVQILPKEKSSDFLSFLNENRQPGTPDEQHPPHAGAFTIYSREAPSNFPSFEEKNDNGDDAAYEEMTAYIRNSRSVQLPKWNSTPEVLVPLAPSNAHRKPRSRLRGTTIQPSLPSLDEKKPLSPTLLDKERKDWVCSASLVVQSKISNVRRRRLRRTSSKNGKHLVSTSGSKVSPSTASGVPPMKKLTRALRVEKLEQHALFLAATGHEEKAISLHNDALLVNQAELARIKRLLQHAQNRHPASVESISDRLYEDCISVTQSVGNIRTKMAILFDRMGDIEGATFCAQESLNAYRQQEGLLETHNRDPSQARESMKITKILQRRIEQAHLTLENRQILHREICVLRNGMRNTCSQNERKHLINEIQEKARAVLQLETDSLGTGHPQVADTLSFLATITLEQNDPNAAFQHLIKGVSITKHALGTKHPHTGLKLLQTAKISMQVAPPDVEKSLDYFMQAIYTLQYSKAHAHVVGYTMNDVAIMRIQRHEFPAALALFYEALAFYKKAYKELNEGDIKLINIQIWRNIAECTSRMQDFDKASEALLMALRIQREARKLCNVSKHSVHIPLSDDASIAESLCRLGKAYVGAGQYVEALTVYEEALLMHREKVTEAHPSVSKSTHPELPARLDQLANALFHVGETHYAIGAFDTALDYYNESMQKRLASDSHRPENRINMVHCAMCLVGIGSIHARKSNFQDALRTFSDAMSWSEAHGTYSARK
jgi:tetratricopeptide (TPR) repeat protein